MPLRGAAVQAPEQTYHCGPGTLIFIKPGVCHSLFGVERETLSGVHLEFGEGNWASHDYRLACAPPATTQLPDESFCRLSALFLELATAFSDASPWYTKQVSCLATYLLMVCGSHWRESNQSPHQSRRAREILAYIRAHLADSGLSRTRIAKAFSMTPGNLNYVFRRDFGCTPVELVHRERCRRAQELLTEHDLSVKEAGYAVGFSSPASFSRTFKKVFAIPPKEARKGSAC